MIREAALRETIIVYASVPGPDDRYGDPTEVDGPPITVAAAMQPGDATEDEINRDTRISRYTVLVTPETAVDGLSRIVWRGRSFEVLGEPRVYTARNGIHHFEFDVQEVQG